MRLGIFAKTFARRTLDEILQAVADHGFEAAQFNMACVGLASMPDVMPDDLPMLIASSFRGHGLGMSALSGTFNMIHPDPAQRARGLQSLLLLIENARAMGTKNVTLCTGTADADDMWRAHPDNDTAAAWAKLRETLEPALAAAEAARVNLLVEPELANVVNSAAKARRLIAEMRSSFLRIVFDPANLFEVATSREILETISEGLDLLGEHIEIAHAKDRLADGHFVAAGQGVLPYPEFLRKLRATGFTGDLITHGLAESEVAGSAAFLKRQLELAT